MQNEVPSQPVKGAEVAALKPEFLRIPTAVIYSGLSRSTLYELMATDRLKSTVVRKRGNTRGIRLISVDSLDAILRGDA